MNTAHTTQSHVRPVDGTKAVAVATLLLGLAVVFLTGFAHSSTIHNAAHDSRHAMAFPCH